MSININSRYADCNILEITTKENDSYTYLTIRRDIEQYNTEENYYTYVIKEQDRLDLIAEKIYKDPTKWWLIADVNSIISPFDKLEIGRILLIPKSYD